MTPGTLSIGEINDNNNLRLHNSVVSIPIRLGLVDNTEGSVDQGIRLDLWSDVVLHLTRCIFDIASPLTRVYERNKNRSMIETGILAQYNDAGYPVIAVETAEESRLISYFLTHWDKAVVMSIAATGGLINLRTNKEVDAAAKYPDAFKKFAGQNESFLLVFDFQHMINGAVSYRPLLQIMPQVKSRGSMIILVSPTWTMPNELKHEIPVISVPLPTVDELKGPLTVVSEASSTTVTPEKEEELLSAARGLTLSEAENVFALASLQEAFPKSVVEREKMRLVRAEYLSVETPRPVSSLGGLGQLKDYILHEVLPAQKDDQLRVKGILLVGVPGTGKSLAARIISALLEWPLIRFDMSAAKGSLVGQSEARVRHALSTADAISPCVLWLDEIEKSVGGYASSSATDGGTTSGMVGTLLTWSQEHSSPVLMVATCNDFSKLPPELTRAGRFDEKFFLDLPTEKERKEIANVHLTSIGCKTNWDDTVAEITPDWTGAEIRQLVLSTARRTNREITLESLERGSRDIIPISKGANIKALREWAKDNLRRANDEDAPEPVATRKVRGR